MSIQYFAEDIAVPKIKKSLISGWIKQVINDHSFKTGDISIIFCSDNYLLNINKSFLDHDYFTDIITFDYVEGKKVSGDIFISLDRVEENSVLFKADFNNELNRIIIHGILHLLGYNDKDEMDKKLMSEKEDFCLKMLTIN